MSPLAHSQKAEHARTTTKLPLSKGIKIVSVLQRLHGKIGRTISDAQKRDGQTDKQTDKKAQRFGRPGGGWNPGPTKLGRVIEDLEHVRALLKLLGIWRTVSPLGGAEDLGEPDPVNLTPHNFITPWANCENRSRDTPLWSVYIRYFDQISVKISVLGSYTLIVAPMGWNLAWWRGPSGKFEIWHGGGDLRFGPRRGPSVSSSMPNVAPSVQRVAGAKNLKIGLWVTYITGALRCAQCCGIITWNPIMCVVLQNSIDSSILHSCNAVSVTLVAAAVQRR